MIGKLKGLHQKPNVNFEEGGGAITAWGGSCIEMQRNDMDMHTSKDGVVGRIFTIFCTDL